MPTVRNCRKKEKTCLFGALCIFSTRCTSASSTGFSYFFLSPKSDLETRSEQLKGRDWEVVASEGRERRV